MNTHQTHKFQTTLRTKFHQAVLAKTKKQLKTKKKNVKERKRSTSKKKKVLKTNERNVNKLTLKSFQSKQAKFFLLNPISCYYL